MWRLRKVELSPDCRTGCCPVYLDPRLTVLLSSMQQSGTTMNGSRFSFAMDTDLKGGTKQNKYISLQKLLQIWNDNWPIEKNWTVQSSGQPCLHRYSKTKIILKNNHFSCQPRALQWSECRILLSGQNVFRVCKGVQLQLCGCQSYRSLISLLLGSPQSLSTSGNMKRLKSGRWGILNL